MDNGYIKLSRSFFNSKLWEDHRAFSECEAWLDLIQSARFDASPITSRIGSYEVTWGRGEYPASVRFLAAKWNRTARWVRDFLDKLKREKMISVEMRSGMSVIRLTNYEKYNSTEDASRTANGTPNTLSDKEILQILAQQTAHLATQQEKLGTMLAQIIRRDNNIIQEPTNVVSLSTDVDAMVGNAREVNFDGLLKFFNETMANTAIPKIAAMNERRKAYVDARTKEYGKQAIWTVIKKAAASTFLNGGGEKAFIASFDWIFRPNNFLKILEGNYDNKQILNYGTSTVNSTNSQQSRNQRAADAASIIARLAAENTPVE